jgi:hypothetical protein
MPVQLGWALRVKVLVKRNWTPEPSPFIETVERLGKETMEAIYKIAREVGPLGALALLVLAYVAAAGEGNVKEWYELGFKDTADHLNGAAVVGAIVLFLVQAAANARFTERAEALQKASSALSVQERDAAIAEATALKTHLSEDQTVIAKRDAEWHKLESVLKGHRALADDDDPRFVSRVVQSAYRLRDELGEFQQSSDVEPSTRGIVQTLRWATDVLSRQ